MKFNHKMIWELFDSSQKTYIIPVYQRAYSWEEKQWSTLLNDLREQIHGNNNYFFGNLLLENVKRGVEYEVIDGQQRLTTLILFMRSILDVLKERRTKGEQFDIDIQEKEKMYLKNKGNIKLRPVDYDRLFFDKLIKEGVLQSEPETPSQEKLFAAKKYFTKELSKESTGNLLKILEKFENTELTTLELEGKKDAALMFELQNNRGKDLTNMEKLKSYFMYQMHVNSDAEEAETNIQQISDIFKAIYTTINDLEYLTEDNVLTYHCNAYVKGYNYSNIEDIKGLLKKQDNKAAWIKTFSDELRVSFSNMKKLERSQDKNLNNLRELKMPSFIYPFLIKAYKYLGNDEQEMSKLFHLLEILVFRFHLIGTRAKIRRRLNSIIEEFKGDLLKLKNDLKNRLNESWYWGDESVENSLHGWMFDNRVLSYLLWRYEDSIHVEGYSTKRLPQERIVRIAPFPIEGEPIAVGYEVGEDKLYSEDFKRVSLNSIGNLVLVSDSQSPIIGNKPFIEKQTEFNSRHLLKQQNEIITFLNGNAFLWGSEAIAKRHKAIVNDFAIKEWSFDHVII